MHLAPQIQRGFPVDIVRNTNLLTYLLIVKQHGIDINRTPAVSISVCQSDTVNVQCHSEVDRPPRLRPVMCARSTRHRIQTGRVVAIVCPPGVISAVRWIDKCTDLVRRTIESHVDVEPTIHIS